MSLFICSNCGCVENTNLVNDDKIETKHNMVLPDGMKPYPHMSLMDMMGCSDNEDIIFNGVIWKKGDEIKMLCSECNTGIWHNQFTKSLPDENEKEIAKYSKYNYITPADHERGAVMQVFGKTDEYKIHAGYEALHSLFRKLFNKKESDNIKDFKDNYFPHLYSIFIEDVRNFYPNSDYEDVDWNSEQEVLNYAISSLIYPKESKSQTLQSLHTKIYGRNYYTTHNDPYMDLLNIAALAGNGNKGFTNLMHGIFNSRSNSTSKPIQTEEEKNLKLQKAEEKRLRKLNKKQSNK